MQGVFPNIFTQSNTRDRVQSVDMQQVHCNVPSSAETNVTQTQNAIVGHVPPLRTATLESHPDGTLACSFYLTILHQLVGTTRLSVVEKIGWRIGHKVLRRIEAEATPSSQDAEHKPERVTTPNPYRCTPEYDMKTSILRSALMILQFSTIECCRPHVDRRQPGDRATQPISREGISPIGVPSQLTHPGPSHAPSIHISPVWEVAQRAVNSHCRTSSSATHQSHECTAYSRRLELLSRAWLDIPIVFTSGIRPHHETDIANTFDTSVINLAVQMEGCLTDSVVPWGAQGIFVGCWMSIEWTTNSEYASIKACTKELGACVSHFHLERPGALQGDIQAWVAFDACRQLTNCRTESQQGGVSSGW